MAERSRPSFRFSKAGDFTAEERRLWGFARTARSAAFWRELAALAIDLVVLGLGLGVVSAAVAWFTQRGDLAQLGFQVSWFLGAAGLTTSRVMRKKRDFGSIMSTLRSIAQASGPLRSKPQDLAGDGRLRRELRAALELALQRRHQDRSFAASPELIERYVAEVATRLEQRGAQPGLALPRPSLRVRASVTTLVALCWLALASSPWGAGFGWVLTGHDARPPAPAEPVWSSLALELHYPAHTGRVPRAIANPSGALRVPAGTNVAVALQARQSAEAMRIVLTYDPLADGSAVAPEVFELNRVEGLDEGWEGSFTVRGSGSWTVVLLEHEDDDLEDASGQSARLPLQLEPDRAPEIELLPLASDQRVVDQSEQVELRFSARDDFGLAGAELVYQLPDGTSHRIPLKIPVEDSRTWRERYSWKLAEIPVAERSEVIYWVEVWDNDPGLGVEPLAEPPGKRVRSATMRLQVRDDEAEHAENIVGLVQLRDEAVDLLAARMTTTAFVSAPVTEEGSSPTPLFARVTSARELLMRGGSLVAKMASAVDALSVDAHVRERDAQALAGIHGRLLKMHRSELDLHESLPPGSEQLDAVSAVQAMDKLGAHNSRQVTQLEDEVIRLDDLVDGQVIKRIEGLVARLEATQRKLVELLEQLKAGDESVRSQIQQLEQRRRDDMRRLAEARAMLTQEVEQEFMNLDAFKILEQMQQQEQLSEKLRQGDLDGALQQARDQLGEVQRLRDQVQERVAGNDDQGAISEEDRERMKLMRALSRLQDEETTLKKQTDELHQTWRQAVAPERASEKAREDVAKVSEALSKRLQGINDARLGRTGREGLEDARDALEVLKSSGTTEQRQLELTEKVEQALQGLRKAQEGSEATDEAGKAVARARKRLEELHQRLQKDLPQPSEILDASQRAALDELHQRQGGLSKQAQELLNDPASNLLPPPGKKALDAARAAMRSSGNALGEERPAPAIEQQNEAWGQLQKAIDSLRRGPPPPSVRSSDTEASTEAERDRSLRDALMDAMKEGAPSGFDEPVKRYYEELLR